MHLHNMLKCIAIFAIIFMGHVKAQFWKLNALNERDVFILETRATMASGICYKQVPSESANPELRIQTFSYCCAGYRQNHNSMGMQCDPVCMEDCANGLCTAPEECTCYPGYERLGGRCEEL